MLYDFFLCSNTLKQCTITETIERVTITLKTNKPMTEFVIKLFDELKTISLRDKFELFFEVFGTTTSISDTSIESLNKIKKHIEEYQDELDDKDCYDLELVIKKHKNNSTISVYFIEHFSKYLNEEKLINVINTISTYFDSKLKFEVFSTIKNFGSKGIFFYQSDKPEKNHEFTPELMRKSQIEMFNENSNNNDVKVKLLPSDFKLEILSDVKILNDVFEKACGALSLMFLANFSSFHDLGISYKIAGYKTIFCKLKKFDAMKDIYNIVYKIFAWSYEGGNSADKIGLARNVLSIHLDSNDDIRFDNEVWDAICSNYQIYLRGNIQSYLEIKNRIGEILIDSTSKTYLMADELLDSLKNNIFIIITFLLTVVLVNGLKDNGYRQIFSDSYLYVVFIIALISTLWMLMVKSEISKRFNSASDTIKEILTNNYNQVIMKSEIDNTVTPIINKNKIYLQNQTSRYTKWWIAILAAFVLVFLIANLTINKSKPDTTVIASEQISTMEPVATKSSKKQIE